MMESCMPIGLVLYAIWIPNHLTDQIWAIGIVQFLIGQGNSYCPTIWNSDILFNTAATFVGFQM